MRHRRHRTDVVQRRVREKRELYRRFGASYIFDVISCCLWLYTEERDARGCVELRIYISFFFVCFLLEPFWISTPHTFYAALAELRLRFASWRNENFALWLNQQWILSAPTLFYFSHLTENMAFVRNTRRRCRHVGHVNGSRRRREKLWHFRWVLRICCREKFMLKIYFSKKFIMSATTRD